MTISKLLMSSFFRLHVLANTEDNSDTGDIELIRHLHVNVSSLKILLQGTTYYYYFSSSLFFLEQAMISISVENRFQDMKTIQSSNNVHCKGYLFYFREHSSI